MKSNKLLFATLCLFTCISAYSKAIFNTNGQSQDCIYKTDLGEISHNFMFSTRYCIFDNKSRTFKEGKTLKSRVEAMNISSRYKEVFNRLENIDDKISFVDLFLVRASKQLHLSIARPEGKSYTSVIINTKSASGKGMSGWILKLFNTQEVADGLSKINSDRSIKLTYSLKLENLVNYVLMGEKIKKKPEVGDYKLLSYEKSKFIIPVLNIMKAPISGNNGCNRACEEYRDWVEQHVEGGGYFNHWWEERTVQGSTEFFIVYEDEYGELHEAHHFYP